MAVREWIRIGKRGCQYLIDELEIAKEVRMAEEKYRMEAEGQYALFTKSLLQCKDWEEFG